MQSFHNNSWQRPVNWVFNAVNRVQAFDEASLFADGPLDLAVGTVCDSQM
jgi:hypothetical protein